MLTAWLSERVIHSVVCKAISHRKLQFHRKLLSCLSKAYRPKKSLLDNERLWSSGNSVNHTRCMCLENVKVQVESDAITGICSWSSVRSYAARLRMNVFASCIHFCLSPVQSQLHTHLALQVCSVAFLSWYRGIAAFVLLL